MKKLKLNDQVLYWDGKSIIDLAHVVEVDKPNSRVKLNNGIWLSRCQDENGHYRRDDYMRDTENVIQTKISSTRSGKYVYPNFQHSRGWFYPSEVSEKIWSAYCFKRTAGDKLEKLTNKVKSMTINELIQQGLDEIINIKNHLENLL